MPFGGQVKASGSMGANEEIRAMGARRIAETKNIRNPRLHSAGRFRRNRPHASSRGPRRPTAARPSSVPDRDGFGSIISDTRIEKAVGDVHDQIQHKE